MTATLYRTKFQDAVTLRKNWAPNPAPSSEGTVEWFPPLPLWAADAANLDVNATGLAAGSLAPYGSRWSWTRSSLTGTTGPSGTGITTAQRFTSTETGSVTGRGVDSYGNPEVAPGTTGDWVAGPSVVPGRIITISRYARSNLALTLGYYLVVRFHDGAGNWVGEVIPSAGTGAVASSTWARPTWTGRVPAGAARFSVGTRYADATVAVTTATVLDLTGLQTNEDTPVSGGKFTWTTPTARTIANPSFGLLGRTSGTAPHPSDMVAQSVPVTSGQIVALSVLAANSGNVAFTLNVRIHDGAGNWLTSESSFSYEPGTGERTIKSVFNPTATGYAILTVGLYGSVAFAAGATVTVSQILIEKGVGTAGPYFDGGYASSTFPPLIVKWEGERDASPSVRQSPGAFDTIADLQGIGQWTLRRPTNTLTAPLLNGGVGVAKTSAYSDARSGTLSVLCDSAGDAQNLAFWLATEERLVLMGDEWWTYLHFAATGDVEVGVDPSLSASEIEEEVLWRVTFDVQEVPNL